MFQVFNSRLAARLTPSRLLCPAFAFRSLLRLPISRSKPCAFGPDISGYSSTISELVITQRTMTAGADVGASPRWEEIWSGGLEKGDKWDTGVVSPALTHLLDSGVLPKGRAFVPGCGRGYEAIAFGKSGSDAIGLDLAPTGIEEAKKVLEQEEEAPSGKVEFIAGDFFEFKASEHGQFDVILDYTFLCAIHPTVREAWADHMVSLLKPEGELVTLIFPIVEKEDGPPYALSESLVSGLLEPRGLKAVRLEMLPPELCHKGREGKTALGRWRFFSTLN